MTERREVFVDASAWISVSDIRDRHHQASRVELNRLLRQRRPLITTNLVISEVYILIRRTGGHTQAMRFLHSLRGSPRLERVYSSADLESAAEEILERFSDQDFSLTDAVSFALMRERGITEAFSLDKHFKAMGFEMLPAKR